jgi:hypothetical protein
LAISDRETTGRRVVVVLEAEMKEKSAEFAAAGAEIYQKA